MDAVMETVAPHAELVSPIVGRMVVRGKPDLRILLAAVYGGLNHVEWTEEIGDGTRRVILGEARIFGVPLNDAMVLDLTADGQIERIRPHLRPWLALTLLFVRLMPMIARHPGVLRRAMRTG
ncbi:hypothetical protein A5706_28890 [Mycobacterium sp. E796]|nr:hypothetical protein A5706_28890 [Mycobacterium sp. E796]